MGSLTGYGGSYPTELMQRLFLEMGLTRSEIEAYQFLLESDTATPTEVARAVRQSRGRIYDTLRQLVAQGFVREQPTKPIRYAPVPLAQTVSMAAAKISQQTRTVRQIQAWMQQAGTSQSAAPAPVATASNVAVTTGRRACNAELERVVAQSRDWLLLSGGANLASRLQANPTLREALTAALARAVEVRILYASNERRMLDVLPSPPDDDRLDLLPPELDDALTCANSESATLEILAQPLDDDPHRGDDLGIRIMSPTYAAAVRSRLLAALPRPI